MLTKEQTIILILSIIIFCLLIFLIVLIIKIYNQKISLKDIKNRIKYIKKNHTNLLVDTASNDSNLIEIVNLFNEMLNNINNLSQKIIHEENEIKNTITNLSHDLRTPITSILGYTQLLQKQSNLSSKQLEYIQIIESRIITLKNLVEELFNYSLVYEQEELKLKNENINLILEEAILLFHDDLVNNQINISLKLLEEPQYQKIHKISLKRVFMNIIGNAIKYGKEILIIEQTPTQIIFKNKIKDIDKIDVEKIFDRFFTVATARTNGSRGLGLTISKILLEKMNYQINAVVEDDLLSIIISF